MTSTKDGEFPKMKNFPLVLTVILAITLVYCGIPEFAAAQQQQQTSPAQTQQQGGQNQGTTIDPSQAPLTPVPAQPDTGAQPAPATSQPETVPASPAPQNSQKQTEHEPLGAAAAEGVRTAGGLASRPAGTAIAPEKQHQTRSLLIKLGAVAAGAAALGAVFALSRGTPSTPPNNTH